MSCSYSWVQYSKIAPYAPLLDSIFAGVHGITKRGTFGNDTVANVNLYGLKISGASAQDVKIWLEDPRSDVVSSNRYVFLTPRRKLAAATAGADVPTKTIIKMMSPGWVYPVILEPCQLSSKANIPNVAVSLVAATYFDGTPAVGARVLVKNQSTASTNGIYEIMTLSAGDVTLLRSADMNCSSDLYSGAQVVVDLDLSTHHWYSLHVAGYPSNPTIGTTSLKWQAHLNYRGNGAGDDILVITSPVRAVKTDTSALTGLLVCDGVQTVAGDRVLAIGQSAATANGVYIVAAGAWTRATDMPTGSSLLTCQRYSVTEGSVYAGKAMGISISSSAAITGTDGATFVEILSLSNPLEDSTKWHLWPNAPDAESRAAQLGNASTDVHFVARSRKIATAVFTPITEYDGIESDPYLASIYHDRLRLMSSFDMTPPGVQS